MDRCALPKHEDRALEKDPISLSRPVGFYMPELDGLRFIAFLLVFVHHLPFPRTWLDASEVLKKAHAFGWIGVDIFLVLSAYLLTRIAIVEVQKTGQFDVRRFFVRRILRIWPLYYLGLLIGFFLYPGFLIATGQGTIEKAAAGARDHLIPYAMFVGNFSYAELRNSLGLYKSLWTICMEEQFYLIFPLIATIAIVGSRRRAILFTVVASIVAAFLFRIYLQIAGIHYPWVWVTLLSRLDPFALGIAIAAFDTVARRNSPTFLLAAIVLVTAGAISSFPQLGASVHTIWQLGLSALGCASLLLIARKHPSLLANPAVAWLGKISFGLYVYHRFTIDIFVRSTQALSIDDKTPVAWIIAASLCLAGTIAIATLSYLFFERRFLNRKTKYELVASRPQSLFERNLLGVK